MRSILRILAGCVVALAAGSAAAQSGGIRVLVLDESSAPLAGATVTISHEAGFVKTAAELTDSKGVAEFPVLRPGGGYAILASFPGLSSIRQDGLRVGINQTLDLSVRMIEFEEQVRVTAVRQMIDLDEGETATKFSSSFMADLPVPGRSYTNILTLAPGVQDADGDGNPNVHGSRARDFQAQVNGVNNVDPLTGQWMSRITPNSIEELEVITAGAGVEFGRAQGGFARVIQKQGNNTHEGVFEYYWSTSKLDGGPEFDSTEPLMQLSGPIVKDNLWYRVNYERQNNEEPINVIGSIEIFEETRENIDAQFTWQVSPRNKLVAQYRSDPLEQKNLGISNVIPLESSRRFDRDVDTYNLVWTAPYSPKVLAETTVTWQEVNPSSGPTSVGVINDCVSNSSVPFLRVATCDDLGTNLTSGSFNRTDSDRRQRFSVKGQATIHAGRFLGLRHQFKVGFGVENERYFRDLNQGASMTYEERIVGLNPPFGVALSKLAVPTSDEVRATGTNWAFFLEDQIKPRSNLTVTWGVRVDQEELNSEGRESFDPAGEFAEYEALIAAGVNSGAATRRSFTGYEDLTLFENQLKAQLCEDVPPSMIGNCQTLVSQTILSQDPNDLVSRRRLTNISIANTNVSPYFSVAWAPWSNGKTALKATSRRYYNNIPLLVPLQELEPALTEVEYRVNPLTQQTKLQGGVNPSISVRTVDRNLRTPYQDEISLTLERELWPETSLHLDYIKREYRDQIQDENVNVQSGDFGRCIIGQLFPAEFRSSVLPSIGGGVGSGVMLQDPYTGLFYEDTDPGPGDGIPDDCAGIVEDIPTGFGTPDGFGTQTFRRESPDGVLDLYLLNPFWGDILQIGNVNRIDYEAYVLRFVRRQYRSWEMQASYTWSKAEGDGEDFFQELGNDPTLQQSVRGFQSYDQRHVVKASATSVTPWGIRLGTVVQWQSGLPYSLLTERIGFDTKPPITRNVGTDGARTRQLYRTGVRNDQRNQAYWNVDLRAIKEIRLKGVNLQLSAEIFNLLDDETYVIYNPDPGFERGQQVNGVNEARRRNGRQWRVGAKLAF